MSFKWILAPLLGCLIGYITNDIAIKMLFHPYKSLYIGKFHIPFTPGLIPQQKERIAKAIGAMVSANLLDSQTLQKTLLSEKTLAKIRTGIQTSLDGLQYDTRTIEQMLLSMNIDPDKLADYRSDIKTSCTRAIMARISSGQLGAYISSRLIEEIKNTLGTSFSERLTDWGIASAVGKSVNDLVMKNAPKVIEGEIEKIEGDIMSLKMCELYQKYSAKIPSIVEETTQLYRQVIEANLDKALAAIDVTEIVVEKIRGFDARQLEEMVFGVMKRELRAIVYLGAALGFLMGFINILF